MQNARRLIQFGFLALTLIGVFVVRGNAERWCPFGGIEAAYTYLREGNVICSLGVSNFYILAGVLLSTLLLRRAFCGYVCPIGTLSEWCGRAAARAGMRPAKVPYRLDRMLNLLPYGVLGAVLFLTYRAGELAFRGFDPCYALISRHGEDITLWAYAVGGGMIAGSLFVTVPFCRWLCPLGAALNPFSRFGLARIRRDETTCTGCAKCVSACPMAIPVDKLREVIAARCTSCMECVNVCPTHERAGSAGSGALFWGPPKALGRAWPQAVLVGVMLACIGAAVATAYAFPVASFVRTRGREPAQTRTLALRVHGLTCRGRAMAFASFVERGDDLALGGYVKIEAWPGPGLADVRITYDPDQTDETAIRQAITEPYFNFETDVWEPSPFEIEGYDPLGLGELSAGSNPEP